MRLHRTCSGLLSRRRRQIPTWEIPCARIKVSCLGEAILDGGSGQPDPLLFCGTQGWIGRRTVVRSCVHHEEILVKSQALAQFRRRLTGDIIVPGSELYDAARKVWNAMIDRRPAVIARCRDAADVACAIAFARQENLPLAVRGGAHNVAGTATVDDGLVLDLSLMKSVEVDPVARRAIAGA